MSHIWETTSASSASAPVVPVATRGRGEWGARVKGWALARRLPRPELVGLLALAGVLNLWALSRNGWANDYYAAVLKDGAGNSFEAVHRDGGRPRGCIDHVTIAVNNVEASTAFYSTIGAAAGLAIRRQTAEGATFSVGTADGSLLVVAGPPTQNVHMAFSASDDDVRRFHASACAAGYRSNGEPRERPRYHDGYFAAYVLDPDGNNVEVVNHHHAPAT